MTYEESVQLRDKLRDYNAYDYRVRTLSDFIKTLEPQSLKVYTSNSGNIVEYINADDQELIIDILTEVVSRTIINCNKIMEGL